MAERCQYFETSLLLDASSLLLQLSLALWVVWLHPDIVAIITCSPALSATVIEGSRCHGVLADQIVEIIEIMSCSVLTPDQPRARQPPRLPINYSGSTNYRLQLLLGSRALGAIPKALDLLMVPVKMSQDMTFELLFS